MYICSLCVTIFFMELAKVNQYFAKRLHLKPLILSILEGSLSMTNKTKGNLVTRYRVYRDIIHFFFFLMTCDS